MKTLFIVDDDETVRIIFKKKFASSSRYKVSYFKTGEQCLQNMDKNPDIVILDFHLNSESPEAEDGLEILKKIQKIDNSIKVIILSSQTHYSKAAQTLVGGAVEYVVKNNDAFDKVEKIVRSL